MKKSKTKRILAIVLSVLMIMTSLPVVAFNAFAADTVEDIETSMAAFEQKMKDGKILKNMAPAYEAYVNCQKALDAYKYGGVANALEGKAAALDSAVAAIGEEWTAATANATVESRDSTDAINSAYATNILYGSKFAVVADENSSNVKNVRVQMIFSQDTVVLKDGNDITIPVSVAWYYDQTGLSNRQMWALYPTNGNTSGRQPADSSDFRMYSRWHGILNYGDNKWNYLWNTNSSEIGCYGATINIQEQRSNGNRKKWNQHANYMKYVGGDTGFSNGYKLVSPGWYAYTSNTSGFSDNVVDHHINSSGNIHIINYEAMVNAMNAKKELLKSVSNYKQGGLSSIMAGFALATADDANPNTYNYSADPAGQAKAAASKVDAAATALNNATAILDNASYENVRTAMTADIISVYNKGLNGWNPDFYAAFKTAFEAAQNMMKNPYTGSYDFNADGVTVANNLAKAYQDLLDSVVGKADKTELKNAILKFKGFNNIFTADSYSAASNVITEVIIAIWGAEDQFGVDVFGPDDNDEGRAEVKANLDRVNEAIKSLRIDPGTIVTTTLGLFSLNQVIEYQLQNAEWYYNSSDFYAAVDAAKQYRNTIAITDFNDYDTQYAEYTAEVQKVLTAFSKLAYALTRIPDNTVYNNASQVTMKELSASWEGWQAITPSYTNRATIIKTTHDVSTVPFGKFNIDYVTDVSNSENGNYKARNLGIDSISIRATASPVTDNFLGKYSRVMADRMCPDNLDDTAKNSTYAGKLEYNSFSVSSLNYMGRTSNADQRIFITDADGNQITDENQAKNYNLDAVLGKTDANCSALNDGYVYGVVFNHSTGGNAHIYIEGDFNVNVTPQKEVTTLTRDTTIPKRQVLNYSGNFGAVTNHACRATTFCSARCYFTSESNSEAITAAVDVVDISYLLDLIKICDAISADKSKYTEESFAAFETALKASKANYDYAAHTSNEFVAETQNRYRALWDAKEALDLADFTVTFNYKDANGADASTSFTSEWGTTLESHRAEIEAIITPDYAADGMTNAFKGWSPSLDFSTVIYSNMTYTATYDSFSSVDWTEYNAAQQKILTKLENNKYYASGLEEVKAAADALSYYSLTDAEKLKVSSAQQDNINAEISKLAELEALLDTFLADSSTYDALVKTVESLNADAYDTAAVQAVMNSMQVGVDITIGGRAYTGYAYDTYITAAMSSMNENAYKYTVAVNDIDYNVWFVAQDGSTLIECTEFDANDMPIAPAGAGQFRYGEVVTATNPVAPGETCSFDVTITAHNTDTATVSRHACTAAEYQFNVRGNTEIYTDAGESTDYKISFVDGRNNTLVYTYYTATDQIRNINTVIANIPTVPFYSIENLTNRATGATVSISGRVNLTDKNTVYTINYGPTQQTDDYTIILLDKDGTQIQKETAKWNQKVTLTAPAGTAGLVDTATDKIAAYGAEYSFYACQSVTLQATETVDGKVSASVAQPVSSNGKVYFTGSFADPGNAKVKGYGIVIDVLGYNNALTLKDVNAANYVYNLAASKLTCGNQFTLYTKAPTNKQNVTYRAYVIYEVDGVELIEYSDVVTTVLQ